MMCPTSHYSSEVIITDLANQLFQTWQSAEAVTMFSPPLLPSSKTALVIVDTYSIDLTSLVD
jgi:hypothetical protein